MVTIQLPEPALPRGGTLAQSSSGGEKTYTPHLTVRNTGALPSAPQALTQHTAYAYYYWPGSAANTSHARHVAVPSPTHIRACSLLTFPLSPAIL